MLTLLSPVRESGKHARAASPRLTQPRRWRAQCSRIAFICLPLAVVMPVQFPADLADLFAQLFTPLLGVSSRPPVRSSFHCAQFLFGARDGHPVRPGQIGLSRYSTSALRPACGPVIWTCASKRAGSPRRQCRYRGSPANVCCNTVSRLSAAGGSGPFCTAQRASSNCCSDAIPTRMVPSAG